MNTPPSPAAPPPTFARDLRETIVLAIPVVIAQLSVIGMHTTDVAMVGNYNTAHLSGMALGNAIAATCFLFCHGTLNAVNPMVSHAEGAGDRPAAGRALGQGLWLALLLAFLVMGLLTQVERMLLAFGQDPTVARIAQRFVTPLSFGYPALFLFVALRQFVEGLSRTRPAMFISVSGLILNAIFNYVLIYGAFGLPELGAVGSGLGTAIVNWINLGLMLIYVVNNRDFRAYDVGAVFRGPRWDELKHLLYIGLPIGVSFGMEIGAFSFAAIFIGWFGPAAIAAHQIALNVCSVTFMVPLGVSIAGSVRVGQAMGRGDLPAVRRAGWATYLLASGFMCMTSMLFFVAAREILSLYNKDPEVLQVGAALLMVGAAFQLADGVQAAGNGVLRGLKDTRIPMIANIIAYWVIGVPAGYILGVTLEWGPTGMWWGLTLGLVVAAFSHLVRFRMLMRESPAS